MERFWQDVRYGMRMLGKAPGFALIAVLTLAAGIGANTAIFSVVNGLLLHPPGVSEPGRVVALRVKYGRLGLKNIVASAPDFVRIRDSRQVFVAAAIAKEGNFNYSSGDVPQRLQGALVSNEWFSVFGAQPLLGRVFTPQEDQPNQNREAVLTYNTWTRVFGADKNIVGRTIPLNGLPYRIIGVMRPQFLWPNPVDLWVPLGLPAADFAVQNRYNESYLAVARLLPHVSFAQASARVQWLTAQDVAHDPMGSYAKDSDWGMFLMPWPDLQFGDLRTALLVLSGAVGFVLLIACANIAGLLLARATGRSREFAVRAALGASRARLLGQSLAENAFLNLAGVLLGVALAFLAVRALQAFAPEGLAAGTSFAMDLRVLTFTAVLGVLTGLIFGAAPAWQVSQIDPHAALAEGGRSASAGRSRQSFRSTLVISEIALALVLLSGTGLLLKTLSNLQQVRVGFEPGGLLTAAVSLPQNLYDTDPKQALFFRSVVERLAASPGVSAAAACLPLPFSGDNESASFQIQEHPTGPGDPGPHGDIRLVTPGYFGALGIPLYKGRGFTEQDRASNPPVAIIDQNLARQYWPGQDPIGQHIRNGDHSPWATIVGVVGHIKFSTLGAEENFTSQGAVTSGKGSYFYPMYQVIEPQAYLVARTGANPQALAGALRSAVHAVDPAQPIFDLRTMQTRIASSLGPRRFALSLLGIFAAMAVLLAAIGLYGLISYSVAARAHEIGIRVALGAQRKDVWRLIFGRAFQLAATGVLAGVAVALLLTRVLASLLYGVSSFDPVTFVSAAALILCVSGLACYVPAHRAMRVDPMITLRYE